MTAPHLHDGGALARRPVVLLGSDGMLGWAWRNLLETSPCRLVPLTRPEAELTDHESIRRLFMHEPRVIINCAGWTDVDGAEKHEDEATAVNGTALAWLAELSLKHGTLLVNYSTDYVFDGRATTPYAPDHARRPLGAYARSKAAGEVALERSGCRFLNIRTSWLYAPWGTNFVRTIARLLREKPSLRVVDDQRGRPTSAEHLARASLGLIERAVTGHWHLTDGGECTWCGFAREIGRLIGAPAAVEPCTTADFPRPAPRPAYSVLDISASEALLGAMPPWQENLAAVVARLES
ncbi:MAG: dTDP-4-dehydrorhamnose reductase [Phycisphaerales bacterium]